MTNSYKINVIFLSCSNYFTIFNIAAKHLSTRINTMTYNGVSVEITIFFLLQNIIKCL